MSTIRRLITGPKRYPPTIVEKERELESKRLLKEKLDNYELPMFLKGHESAASLKT